MHTHLIWTVAFTTLVLVEAMPHQRNKRANEDNFKVLLNIYKINPLKQSRIFKQFATDKLMLNRMERPALIMESHEETPKENETLTKLDDIEETIHYFSKTQRPVKSYIIEPQYSVPNVPEEFKNTVKNGISCLKKNDILDNVRVTKLLPVNETSRGKIVTPMTYDPGSDSIFTYEYPVRNFNLENTLDIDTGDDIAKLPMSENSKDLHAANNETKSVIDEHNESRSQVFNVPIDATEERVFEMNNELNDMPPVVVI